MATRVFLVRHGATVLSAEDTAGIRAALHDALIQKQIAKTVVSTENGFEALIAFHNHPVLLATYLVLGLPFLLTQMLHSRTREVRDLWVACATIAFHTAFQPCLG